MQRMDSGALMIRPSEIRDAGDLIALDHLVWTEETTPGPLKWRSREDYLQHSPPGSQLLALNQGRLYGYVGFGSPSPMKSHRHVCEINIAVHPEFRRSGIGRQLVEAVKRHVRDYGIRKLRLRVLASNEVALTFYRSCGFQEEGRLREEFYLGGHYVDEIFMGLMLTGEQNEETGTA
ncbi:GNAT family N-acetyltransferase [Paenibacillus agri]|uniref:GNAT family N-acetyltransferase n=1 Tax=Paenibacillus agri TaxID=2744309 RepID=A0A850EHC0_9BACL|nr:GNAT family N-acetyltransferase [Paenibacillus agri]NUU59786.1 GNAT family N-acetyltransferase [Paenibacillus agri]